MPPRRLLTASELRFSAVLLVFFLLAGALASLIFAIERFPAPRNHPGIASNVPIGPSARWPSSTPHDIEWPPPQIWQRATGFGVRHHRIWGGDEEEGGRFSMELSEAGWPLPALEQKQMWWDWENPALDGPDSDPAMAILYPALAVNALVVGGGAWLILVALPLALAVAWRFWLRANRALQGRCLSCGYDIGDIDTCPECGMPALSSTKARATA